MALTYSSFNTFADVESWYERIKPLGGAANAGKDIRPIGDRGRKWERIAKVSDNCYALSDGFHHGDEYFGKWLYRGDVTYTPTLKDMAFYAPIVWRKHKDGTETITFRNGAGNGTHNRRYAFLYRHTPHGVGFRSRNGKHFIEAAGGTYYLAKGKTVPRVVWENTQKELATVRATQASNSWRLKYLEWQRAKDDGASLTFKRTDIMGGRGYLWEFVSSGKPVPVPPKKRVDLKTKAKLKPHVEAFRDWVLAVGPLMPTRDYQYERSLRDGLADWGKETGTKVGSTWSLAVMLEPKLSRQIMADEAHPMRLQLAYVAVVQAELLTPCLDEDDVKQVKAAFNRWVNKHLGLVKEVKG
jgi:hypothetical protein